MYSKVLAAFDGSEGSRRALRRAITLARLYDASLTMVWVRATLPHHALSLNEDQAESDAADEYFEGLKQQAIAMAQEQRQQVECTSIYGDAAYEIVHFAEKKGFDLIVIGQTGHVSIIDRLLGQTADRVSETAK